MILKLWHCLVRRKEAVLYDNAEHDIVATLGGAGALAWCYFPVARSAAGWPEYTCIFMFGQYFYCIVLLHQLHELVTESQLSGGCSCWPVCLGGTVAGCSLTILTVHVAHHG